MNNVYPHSLLTDFDVALFQSGKHFQMYKKLGSHLLTLQGIEGAFFAVWAPNASSVSVIGNFNGWNPGEHTLLPRWDKSGIWEGFIPGIKRGYTYKYHIQTNMGINLDKGDPYAFKWETPPKTASVVWDFKYRWQDQTWLNNRTQNAYKPKPFSVYEVHIGSWKKLVKDGNRSLNYHELATELVEYVAETGFTHIEFLPVMEHPYFPSWGYQITGYFAPSSRFGDPEALMYLIDACHQREIGVILDWVPSHFPGDIHGLYAFDGSHLYEYADRNRGFHPDWNSYVFDYGRNEVRSFLISNALFWLETYHADGLRVDAVASMLYLDYSRKAGEWMPNVHGGRENLEAISLLQEFNQAVDTYFPGVETIAEESTAFPKVSHAVQEGGLGFNQKWMMGWMHDTLSYFKRPTVFRKWHQNEITFSLLYAFSEKFMLPLSHDEVVHLKGSLLQKMPGDTWQRFANLRALFGIQWTHPGHQLLFMGGEIGQPGEWSHDAGVQWNLLQYPRHRGIKNWVTALNHFYTSNPALWIHASDPNGFKWVSGDDVQNSVIAFLRIENPANQLLVVCHLAPGTIENYQLGVPIPGTWTEVLNSDKVDFGGTGNLNPPLPSTDMPSHGFNHSISFKLAPLAVQIFQCPVAPLETSL